MTSKSNFVVDTWEDSDDDGDQSVDRDDFYHKLNEDSLIGPPMVEYKLGPKEIEEIKREFNKHDKNRLGYIKIQKIIEVFIKVGQNPSKTLEQTLLSQAYKQDGMIYFSELIALFEKYWKTPEYYEQELRNSFKVFDPEDTDMIHFEELKRFLSIHGDQLDNKELELFHKVILDKKMDITRTGGKILIEDLMKKLMIKAKGSKKSKDKKGKKKSVRSL